MRFTQVEKYGRLEKREFVSRKITSGGTDNCLILWGLAIAPFD